ncbi:matrixin family metalloprotease [Geodermatophilus normandii]|uniref:Peptidase metallopeptidase domain-containing protein n=1 Tax=Geodermatophilus normandii TaxID=1137989 RepID=A0A6P0GFR5_9ACTN|nr:matrixin family metalloprotease [Geodermatophilus normandii]NEM06061.1 hypothetical protein [Geodermatophilus normandii]
MDDSTTGAANRVSSATSGMTGGAPPRSEAALDEPFFDLLKERLRQVDIDGTRFWRAESDYLLDEDELFVYSQQRSAAHALQQAKVLAERSRFGSYTAPGLETLDAQERGLVGIVRGGRIVRWKPGTILTYCVLRKTFPQQAQYDDIATRMAQATADWEATCGVSFEHAVAADESDDVRPAGVVFPVRHIEAGGAFIAAAFFPQDPPSRRRVLIDPSYFTQRTFDRTGVLRHELGHVLGFRHEHIRSGAPPVCPDEDLGGVLDLTQYDPQSVMHYFCGGVGSPQLAITALDRTGSQSLYGPPFDNFHDITP